MAEYSVQSAQPTGSVAVTYAAPAATVGDLAMPGARRELRVKTAATGTTVTVVGARACNQSVIHDLVVVIGTNAEAVIALPPERFGRTADGKAAVNYTSIATVTVALVEV